MVDLGKTTWSWLVCQKISLDITWSQILSPKYDIDPYMGTLFGDDHWDLCWDLGRAKKLDPTLNTSLTNIYAQNNQAPTSMIITRISMFSWGSNVGTWDPMWTGPNYLKHIEGFPQIPLEWRYNSWKYGFKYCKESLEWKIK